jgi:peptidylprolyl isomerase
MVVPPGDGFGHRGDPQANIMSTDTLVFVFDLLGATGENAHATGTVVPYHPGPGLPRVSWGPHGAMITPPAAGQPPRSLIRRILVRGHGRPVQSGQTVVVQYTGVVWRTARSSTRAGRAGSPNRSSSARAR